MKSDQRAKVLQKKQPANLTDDSNGTKNERKRPKSEENSVGSKQEANS